MIEVVLFILALAVALPTGALIGAWLADGGHDSSETAKRMCEEIDRQVAYHVHLQEACLRGERPFCACPRCHSL